MFTSVSEPNYMPKSQDYYDGFKDGYEVAKQEVRDFYERMGNGTNAFTGTACVRSEFISNAPRGMFKE